MSGRTPTVGPVFILSLEIFSAASDLLTATEGSLMFGFMEPEAGLELGQCGVRGMADCKT